MYRTRTSQYTKSESRDGVRIQKSRRRRSWRKKLTQVEVKINSSGKIRQKKEVAANTLCSKPSLASPSYMSLTPPDPPRSLHARTFLVRQLADLNDLNFLRPFLDAPSSRRARSSGVKT
ncbi:hypothetical protein E2C01_045577 [Portunus trituberculatus]|uniref:Uncharacterized protein n=1 Tax=Portunus trituberculatus TaxID=210409 RepID=A0A5B7G2U9_PORTR|nr:hypothetical protein [Portunus trituberculatus]